MNVREFYGAVGGNYDDAMKRLMKDELAKRFLLKFPNDKSFDELTSALDVNDTEGAFNAAHTLKGVCANLSLDALFAHASKVTEFLRAGDIDSAKEAYPALAVKYAEVVEKIGEID